MRFCDCQAINAAMRRRLTGATSHRSCLEIPMNANVRRGLLMVGALGGSVVAQAAAVDVTGAVTDIGLQAAPVGLVGVACLLVYGAVKAFGWVRGALK